MILGFCDTPTLEDHNDPFPSQVGGKPTWIHKEDPLRIDNITCGNCGKPMILLTQIYAPEEMDYAYHRMIYLFVCRNGKCHQMNWKLSIKVIRSQSLKSIANQKTATTCSVCGLYGDKRCGQCKRETYCGKDHQIFHWNTGGHSQLCSSPSDSLKVADDENISNGLLFSRSVIVHEEEEEDESQLVESMSKSMTLMPRNDNWTSGDLEQFKEEEFEEASCEVDKAFLRFQKIISKYPDQILRYARNSSTSSNVEPLWINEEEKPIDIPPCISCGEKRSFEFQILPQILNEININHADPHSLDFGILCVYTCHYNCDIALNGKYVEEFVWRQDCSQHGLGQEFKEKRFGLQ